MVSIPLALLMLRTLDKDYLQTIKQIGDFLASIHTPLLDIH